MAFGNGAPDIFSSVVAVLGVDTPKVHLVLGQLLGMFRLGLEHLLIVAIGAGMFVTTCVVATIVIVRPFHVMRRPFVRDILFYIVALGIMSSVVATGRLTIWQPAGVFFHVHGTIRCTCTL